MLPKKKKRGGGGTDLDLKIPWSVSYYYYKGDFPYKRADSRTDSSGG